jgi:hypothetical protein
LENDTLKYRQIFCDGKLIKQTWQALVRNVKGWLTVKMAGEAMKSRKIKKSYPKLKIQKRKKLHKEENYLL